MSSQPLSGQMPQTPQQPEGVPSYSTPAQYGQQGQYAPQGHYAQQGQPGAPVPPAPQPPKRNWFARHKFLTGIGAVVALVVGIAAFSGGGDEDTTAADGTTQEENAQGAGTEEVADEPADADPASDAPGIGDAALDGSFEFVVTEIETGVEAVGNEFLGSEAQGQFVLVHLTVTNTGNEPQYFSDADQMMLDTEDRQHSADSEAGIYIGENDVLLNEINPGNTASGVLVFDLPADAEPAGVQLHDSFLSGGVTVDLQ